MSLEVIISARPTVEHDNLLRISAFRHSVLPLGIVGSVVQAVWTRDAEASASSDASASCYCFPKDVMILAVVMAKLELGKIERQIFLADMVVGSDDSALQKRPERIDILGMNLAAHILALTMRDGFMAITVFQHAIAWMLVGCDQINFVADCTSDERIESLHIGVLDHPADDVSLTRNSADDWNLASRASGVRPDSLAQMFILLFSADIGFVNFDDAHKLAKIWIIHRSAQAMAHIPSRAVVAASYLALDLKCADSLFGVEHLPEHFKPSLQRIVCVLEDSSRDYRESISVALAARFVRALPFPRLSDLVDVIRFAAARASNLAVRPTALHQELPASIVRWEGRHQLSEGHHVMKDNTGKPIRQVPQNRLCKTSAPRFGERLAPQKMLAQGLVCAFKPSP
jgi:hypothetical protein